MAQLWAALKSLGAIADLLRDVLAWLRELRRKQALDQADALHDANQQAIDAAFAEPLVAPSPFSLPPSPPDRLPDPSGNRSGPSPAVPPAIPSGPGGRA